MLQNEQFSFLFPMLLLLNYFIRLNENSTNIVHYNLWWIFPFQKMKTEEKSNIPKVRIAVIGKSNVGKSGKVSFNAFCPRV